MAEPPSIHVLPAVDRQRRTGDEARFLADEEGDSARDLMCLAEPPYRDLGDNLAEHVLRHRGDHIGVDIAGRDGIDRDAIARALLGQRLGEPVNARLGGGIIDLAVLARLAVDRADVDDSPVLARAHAVEHRLGHIEAAAEVDVDHLVPLPAVHLANRSVAGDPGVIDQHIGRPEVGAYDSSSQPASSRVTSRSSMAMLSCESLRQSSSAKCSPPALLKVSRPRMPSSSRVSMQSAEKPGAATATFLMPCPG